MKRGLLAALLTTSALALPVAGAPAATRHHRPTVKTVIRDCADNGRLARHYSLALLRRARRHLPADVREYSSCSRVLSRAIKREQRRLRHRHHHHRGRR
jgi:hypothetical protein